VQAHPTEVVEVLLESKNAWNDRAEVTVGGGR